MSRFFRFMSVCFLLVSCISFFLPAHAEHESAAPSSTRLLCLNIGKADCMLLLAEDHAYLIDAGYEHTYPALETALNAFDITHLDGVFLTHVHQDHEGGLMQLAKSDITVDHWYAAAIYYDKKPTKHLMYQAAASRNMSVTWLESGDIIPLSDDAAFHVLGPLRTNTENENNNSLVMRFVSPDGSILFTGDMKEEEEADLLAAKLLTPCDFLKVGHHGDNKATTQALLNIVRPKAAVISTSTIEEPDTPARSTLARLTSIGTQVFVTQDMQDGVLFSFDNGRISAQDISWAHIPERITSLQVQINTKADTFTIYNSSDSTVKLSGFYLYSSKGNDTFPLPDITLQAGAQYVIGSGKSTVDCDYIAQKKRIWHDEDRDAGLLYDAFGRIIAGTDNKLPE